MDLAECYSSNRMIAFQNNTQVWNYLVDTVSETEQIHFLSPMQADSI